MFDLLGDAAPGVFALPAERGAPDGGAVAGGRRAPGGAEGVDGGVPGGVAGSARALGAVTALLNAGSVVAEAVTGCRQWPAADRAAALGGLDRLAGVLATAKAGLLVAEQHAGTSIAPGDRDFSGARARATRTGYGQAAREVAQATTLVAMPAVAGAVRDGLVPLPHVDALARVNAAASPAASAVLTSPQVQERVVGLARRLGVKDFTAQVSQLAAAADPAALERDHAAQRAARYLHLSHTADGTHLRARLDRVAGEVLRVALAAAGQGPDQTRDKAQADADALVILARRATVTSEPTTPTSSRASTGNPGTAGGGAGRSTRPHLSLLVPAETFAQVTALARAGAQASDPATEGGTPRSARRTGGPVERSATSSSAVPPATLEDGTPVPSSALAAALCDCDISRIVLTAGSVPVDLGRTQRLYPAAHRRAVILRDRHCAWNGCATPATYCDVHHIRWWRRDDGPTSLDNAVLLCDHHHHVVHALDLTIHRHPPAPRGGPPEPSTYTFRARDGSPRSTPVRRRQ